MTNLDDAPNIRFFSHVELTKTSKVGLKANKSISAHVVDCAQATNQQAFFDVAAPELSFPSDFGRNWDAFADCFDAVVSRAPNVCLVALEHADQLLAVPDNAQDLARLASILVERFQPSAKFPEGRLLVYIGTETGNAPLIGALVARGEIVLPLPEWNR